MHHRTGRAPKRTAQPQTTGCADAFLYKMLNHLSIINAALVDAKIS